MTANLPLLLGIAAATLLLAALAVRLSSRVGLPSLLVYLAIGLLLGESGLGIDFDDTDLTQVLGLTALVVILAEGGLSTRWSVVRPGLNLALALSTVAVAVSIAVAGAALHVLLGLEWQTALLWGAVLSSTDAAAVFSVLRGVKVTPRLAGTVEMESGLNDAPAYIAVVLLASEGISWLTPLIALYQLLGGAILGVAIGWLGVIGLRRAALPAVGLYPIATFAVCLLAFAVPQALSLSGLLGAYLAGVVLGNSHLPHRMASLSFAEGLGWRRSACSYFLVSTSRRPDSPGRSCPRSWSAPCSSCSLGSLSGNNRDAVPDAGTGTAVPVLGRLARSGSHRPGARRIQRRRTGRSTPRRRRVRTGGAVDLDPGQHPCRTGASASVGR